MARWGLILIATVLLFGAAGAARAEQREALVIGNNLYQHAPRLQNAVRDGKAVADLLTSRGFRVLYDHDVDRRGMNRLFDTFVSRLSPGTIAVVYFSGHGVQVNGTNVLIPVDLEAKSDEDIVHDGLLMPDWLDRMTAANRSDGGGVNLMIIDACRDNPFKVAGRSLGLSKGLARVGGGGAMVLYAAANNQSALDRLYDGDPDPNGVFTRMLLRAMNIPGLSVHEMALRVRMMVSAAARERGQEQVPAFYDEAEGDFVFTPGRPPGVPAPQVAMAIPAPTLAPQPPPVGPAPATDCDRLAQPPRNWMGRIPSYADGVAADQIEGGAALSACQRAIRDYPNEPRFLAWMGRALARLNRNSEAVSAYQRAANQGNGVAQTNLGLIYVNGQGVSQNHAEAIRLFRLAADQGISLAQQNLGLMYVNGNGIAQNYAEAARLFRLAADQGNAPAQYNLGLMYANGQGVGQNTAEAIRLFRLAADQGDANRQYSLGAMYVRGQEVPQNFGEAFRLFRLAADQGNALAQSNLGVMYENGQGVPQNYAEALRLYRLAADQGNANGEYNLGVMYANGRGVAQNYTEAIRFYRLAADQGNALARYNIGVMYSNGQGVPKNYTEALRFYRLSADQGNALAQYNLGVLYENGTGVAQNSTEALRLYRLAADQGVAEARSRLVQLHVTK